VRAHTCTHAHVRGVRGGCAPTQSSICSAYCVLLDILLSCAHDSSARHGDARRRTRLQPPRIVRAHLLTLRRRNTLMPFATLVALDPSDAIIKSNGMLEITSKKKYAVARDTSRSMARARPCSVECAMHRRMRGARARRSSHAGDECMLYVATGVRCSRAKLRAWLFMRMRPITTKCTSKRGQTGGSSHF
jgi:hypothetical protein